MESTIEDIAHILAFRKDVRDALGRYPFSEMAREEILLALTEIGTNLIRHGHGGVIEICLPTMESPFLRIRSTNRAMASWSSEPEGGDETVAEGLGIGLSSLDRLMEKVRVDNSNGGFLVTCEKRLPHPCGS